MSEKINESAPRPGKTVYGAALGILMLDTSFPRIHGDIGNAETWPFPVIYKIVEGATSDKVVRKGAAGLKDDFARAAKEIVAMGADGIGTTCGFLSLFQDDIAAAAGVPVASSSLMQVPWTLAACAGTQSTPACPRGCPKTVQQPKQQRHASGAEWRRVAQAHTLSAPPRACVSDRSMWPLVRQGAGCDIRQVVCEWGRERERESIIETSQGGVVAFSIS